MNTEEKILQMLTEMWSDIGQINGRLDSMDGRLDRLEATQAEQGKALDRLETTVNEIDQRSARTQILLETDYADKLQLLFDGHELIKEKLDGLAPKSRVDGLEDDVAMLKDVVKLMRQEIAELKKAQ